MAKGKYADVVPDLPRLAPESVPYQERVDEVKKELETLNTISLAERYTELRREKDRIKELESLVNLHLEAVTQMLVASQDAGDAGWGQYGVGKNALRLASGDTIRVKSEPYGKVLDKEAFRQWCVANGYERQLQLWPTTTNAITKERLLAGENLPDGIEVFRKDSLVFTAAGERSE
jgi:hypothetical protein